MGVGSNRLTSYPSTGCVYIKCSWHMVADSGNRCVQAPITAAVAMQASNASLVVCPASECYTYMLGCAYYVLSRIHLLSFMLLL